MFSMSCMTHTLSQMKQFVAFNPSLAIVNTYCEWFIVNAVLFTVAFKLILSFECMNLLFYTDYMI